MLLNGIINKDIDDIEPNLCDRVSEKTINKVRVIFGCYHLSNKVTKNMLISNIKLKELRI